LLKKGLYYENTALRWLKAKGLKVVARNYHSNHYGEIDLIMLDQQTLCFIEVKIRKDNAFGGTAYSIPRSKQQKIIRTALSFLKQQGKYNKYAMRFDALFIQPGPLSRGDDIEWIKNTFRADDFNP